MITGFRDRLYQVCRGPQVVGQYEHHLSVEDEPFHIPQIVTIDGAEDNLAIEQFHRFGHRLHDENRQISNGRSIAGKVQGPIGIEPDALALVGGLADSGNIQHLTKSTLVACQLGR